ncbi:MAG TPA: choice-of-anchor Q domain-containing protein [Gaiellaceae bacterium]
MLKRLLFAAAAALLVGLPAGPGHATGGGWFVAPTGSDAAGCADAAHPCQTIAAAVAKAASFDTVNVAAGTYTAAAGDAVVELDKSLTLAGTDAVIDGQGVRRGIYVGPGVIATITGFDVEQGTETVTRARPGGGILNDGSLTLDSSTVRGNAHGGIDTEGPLTVTNSTISGNTANVSNEGGGITAAGDANLSLSLVNSTIANNTQTGDGGGIKLNIVSPGQSTLDLANVTISGNAAQGGGGGGIYVSTGWHLRLADTIVSGNTAGLSFERDIAANNQPVDSFGYNIVGTGLTLGLGDSLADAQLQPLADNGGPTQTMAPAPGSPAIDGGNPNNGCRLMSGGAITTDQRGLPRAAGAFDACDIGAVEVQPPANDDFAAAQALAGASGSSAGANVLASVEADEPLHAGDGGGASVWFSWTAPTSGQFAFDTIGSSFDTLLAVYTGGSLAGLVPVASNDDRLVSSAESRTCFNASAGTTYRIAVDGYAGDTGAYRLAWGAAGTATCEMLPPQITGTPRTGQVLTASDGTWLNAVGVTARQWLRCQAEACDPIAGATGAQYVVTARDAGTHLTAAVRQGDALAFSDPSAVASTASTIVPGGRVFFANNSSGHFEIWSANAFGGLQVQLTHGSTSSAEPAPSPDGTRVAFSSGLGIETMSAEGTNVVDTGLQGGHPSWSPDGSRLVYTHYDTVNHRIDGLNIAAADGSNDLPLLRGGVDDLDPFIDPTWSPDGSQIAFTFLDTTSGHYDIGVIGADGLGLLDVTNTATEDEHSPAWSPDGTRLAYIQGPFFGGITKGDVHVVEADGTNDVALIANTTSANLVSGAAWLVGSPQLVISRVGNGGTEDLFTIDLSGQNQTPFLSFTSREIEPAVASKVAYAIGVTFAGSGAGTVTGTGFSPCTSSCTLTYPDGANVTLTATPAAGSTFDGWSGACSGTGACATSMFGARSVTATFSALRAPPPPSSGGGGGGGGSGPSTGIPPDIHVDVTASAGERTPGADLIWFVTVSSRNVGGSSDVKLELTLPAGWTFDHAYADRGPGCVGTPPALTCDVGFINQNATTHVTLFGKVAETGALALTATATSQLEPEADPRDNSVTLALFRPSAPPAVPPAGPPTPVPAPAPPAIHGSPKVGSTLRVTPVAGAHYQWQLCTARGCTNIRGATKPALKVATTYAGKSVRVAVTVKGKTRVSKKLAVRARAASR